MNSIIIELIIYTCFLPLVAAIQLFILTHWDTYFFVPIYFCFIFIQKFRATFLFGFTKLKFLSLIVCFFLEGIKHLKFDKVLFIFFFDFIFHFNYFLIYLQTNPYNYNLNYIFKLEFLRGMMEGVWIFFVINTFFI